MMTVADFDRQEDRSGQKAGQLRPLSRWQQLSLKRPSHIDLTTACCWPKAAFDPVLYVRVVVTVKPNNNNNGVHENGEALHGSRCRPA